MYIIFAFEKKAQTEKIILCLMRFLSIVLCVLLCCMSNKKFDVDVDATIANADAIPSTKAKLAEKRKGKAHPEQNSSHAIHFLPFPFPFRITQAFACSTNLSCPLPLSRSRFLCRVREKDGKLKTGAESKHFFLCSYSTPLHSNINPLVFLSLPPYREGSSLFAPTSVEHERVKNLAQNGMWKKRSVLRNDIPVTFQMLFNAIELLDSHHHQGTSSFNQIQSFSTFSQDIPHICNIMSLKSYKQLRSSLYPNILQTEAELLNEPGMMFSEIQFHFTTFHFSSGVQHMAMALRFPFTH